MSDIFVFKRINFFFTKIATLTEEEKNKKKAHPHIVQKKTGSIMVKFFLKILGELTNVTDLEPVDTPESPYEYTFQIECTKCRTIHDKDIHMNRFEQHEMSGSRGEASFVFRCKECKNEHSASITRTNEKLVIGANRPATILEIDARGLDFTKFIPDGKFQALGEETGTKFDEVDLEDGEWYDVDEKTNEEVSIVDVKWTISRS